MRVHKTATVGQRTYAEEETKSKEDAMFQKLREWLVLKNYQYQVTTGIYMLEPWERTIFSILLMNIFLIFTNLTQIMQQIFVHSLCL